MVKEISTAVKHQKQIFAVVGPKGGVGKSTISANLAISLAKMGKSVVIADLDLGGANLHAILGIRNYNYTLDDFILKKVKSLTDIVIETDVDNLRFVCGGSGIPNVANMPYQQKKKLIRHLLKLDSDILIMDLGAGSSYNVVDFSFIADKGLFVTTPEVTSLINVYSFIKSSIFRRLSMHFKSEKSYEVLELLEKAKDPRENPHLNTMEKFFQEAGKIDPGSVLSAKEILFRFAPCIVINRVQTPNDTNVGKVIQNLMKKYVSIDSLVLTALPEDAAVKKSISRLKPVAIENPASEFSRALKQLAKELTGR